MAKFNITNPDTMKRVLRAFAASRQDPMELFTELQPHQLLQQQPHSRRKTTHSLPQLHHGPGHALHESMGHWRIRPVASRAVFQPVNSNRAGDNGWLRKPRGTEGRGWGRRLECPLDGQNRRLAVLGIQGEKVSFASRYVPEDIVLILRTLEMLSRVSCRSLARFLSVTTLNAENPREAVDRAAAALDGLTYCGAGAIRTVDLPAKMRGVPDQVRADVERILTDPRGWVEYRMRSFRRFGKKRLWCSLRDYLKSPEFNTHFVRALKDAGRPDADRWHRDNPDLQHALDQLELPGDVWNNNDVFANGLFMLYLENNPKTWDMPRTVREMYNLLADDLHGTFYPEQLDVTFDFVPRMCERQMCHVCIFGGGVSRLCHRQTGLLCPVPLVACGYQHACDPDDCASKTIKPRPPAITGTHLLRKTPSGT